MKRALGILLLLAVPLPLFGARVAFVANVRQFTGGAVRSYVNVVLLNCSLNGFNLVAHAAGYTPAQTVMPSQVYLPDSTGLINSTIVPNADITCGVSTGTTKYRIEVWRGQPTDTGCAATATQQCRQLVFSDVYTIAGDFDLGTAADDTSAIVPALPDSLLKNGLASQTVTIPGGRKIFVVGGTLDLTGTTVLGLSGGNGSVGDYQLSVQAVASPSTTWAIEGANPNVIAKGYDAAGVFVGYGNVDSVGNVTFGPFLVPIAGTVDVLSSPHSYGASFSSQTTVLIPATTHLLGPRGIAAVYDASGNFLSASPAFFDAMGVEFQFVVPKSGRVVLLKGGVL